MQLTYEQKRRIIKYVKNGISTKSIMEDDVTDGDDSKEAWDAVRNFLSRICGHLSSMKLEDDE